MKMVGADKAKKYWMLLSLALILLIFSQIFSIAIKEKMHQRIPESLGHYAQAISIAISHKNFNLDGYVGYRSVYDTLINSSFDWEHHTNATVLNNAIKKAREDTHIGSERIFFMGGDVGFIDYVSLAFKLFGFNIESFLYLYMAILFLQIMVFFAEFRNERLIIVGLILFLLSHYITANCLVGAGYNLWTFHNSRFLSVLGILPIMHICLLALFNKKLKLSTISGALVQILIYIFILNCRKSALWLVGPVLLMGGLWLLNKLNIYLFKVKEVKLWPVVLTLLAVFGLSFIKPYILDAEYYSERNTSSHTFWYPIYVGLAIDPDIREIYGPRVARESVDSGERFAEVCDQSHPEDSSLKAKARIFVCKYRSIADVPLVAIRNWHEWIDDYTQIDADGAEAVLKWLRKNGETEEYLYTFGPEDKVGYPRWFGYSDSIEKTLAKDPSNANLRKFDAKKDLKWREVDRILKEVFKEAVIEHPFKVFKTIFIVKPFFFFVWYFLYFIRVTSVIGLLLIIGSYLFLLHYIKEMSDEDIKKLLAVVFGMFILSMVVILATYPSKHTISDQAILLTMGLLGLILFFLKKKQLVKLKGR